MSVVEQLIAEELEGPVKLVEEFQYDAGTLSVWAQAAGFPRLRTAVFESVSSTYVVPTSLNSISRFLRDIQFDLQDVAALLPLLPIILPRDLSVITQHTGKYVRETIDGGWSYPEYNSRERKLVFYCNDFGSGKLIRLTIDEQYVIDAECVGSGIEFGLQ